MAQKKAEKPHKYVQSRGPTKTFFEEGHWVEKQHHTPVLMCHCGTRYLKTRPGQKMCLGCMHLSEHKKR